MKKNPPFRYRVMQSKYFQPSGNESLADVVHAFGDPFPIGSVYVHMGRHQNYDLRKARERFKELEHPQQGIVNAAAAVEGEVVTSGEHELGLDEFIREGRQKLLRNEMPISATNYLAAIKIKADIQKSAKDRRLDMIKSFFAGGDKKSGD